jgi:tubulin---tyrosine ligase
MSSVLDFDELRVPLAYAHLFSGLALKPKKTLYNAILAVDCPYAFRHFSDAFARRPWWRVITNGPGVPIVDGTDEGSVFIKHNKVALQIDEYERVDWDVVMKGGKAGDSGYCPMTNNFCIRKGLSRKANFALQMSRHARRFPESAIAKALPETALIDTVPVFHSRPHWLDLRSALNEALLDADEAIEAAAKEAGSKGESKQPPLWILKPSLGNKAMEIAIVSTIEQVTAFLKEWRDIGQWVLQRYIERPLLLNGGRKFHIRLYVLVNAAMEVYVFREALLLFAVNKYNPEDGGKDLHSHITNTCVGVTHSSFNEEDYVKRLSDLPSLLAEREGVDDPSLYLDKAAALYSRICSVVSDCFLALERETSVYMPLEGCFELYGADLVLEEQEEQVDSYLDDKAESSTKISIPLPRVLEFNPTPDIKQTGKKLDFLIGGLVEGVMKICVDSRLPPPSPAASPSSSDRAPAAADKVLPRVAMREAPIAHLQKEYKRSWLEMNKGNDKRNKEHATLVWDKVLSIPASAGAGAKPF